MIMPLFPIVLEFGGRVTPIVYKPIFCQKFLKLHPHDQDSYKLSVIMGTAGQNEFFGVGRGLKKALTHLPGDHFISSAVHKKFRDI